MGGSCFYNPIKVSDNLINGRRQLKNRASCTRAKRCQKATDDRRQEESSGKVVARRGGDVGGGSAIADAMAAC